MDVFWTLPPVTRTITALAVVVSALGHSGMIGLYNYYYYAPLIFTLKTTPQVWRLFTAFLITKPKFAILMDPYFLYQYGSSVERESSRFSKPGDFFVYTAFVSTVIVAIAGGLLNGFIFLPSLSLAYAYTFAQDNPGRQVSFFIITFDTKFLPFALLGMTFVIDGPGAAYTQLAGLIAAHLYDFLTRIWPTFGGGKNYITTPLFVQRWFAPTPGAAQNRGFGTAMQGGGRSTADSASTGRSTGSQWGSMGPGRRLGGE